MKKSAGFTLIEVLVAATIMSVVIVGTFMLLSSATRQ
ncbi:MAG: PulJ/GspJ family protein [Patescibacteria group bacterium]